MFDHLLQLAELLYAHKHPVGTLVRLTNQRLELGIGQAPGPGHVRTSAQVVARVHGVDGVEEARVHAIGAQRRQVLRKHAPLLQVESSGGAKRRHSPPQQRVAGHQRRRQTTAHHGQHIGRRWSHAHQRGVSGALQQHLGRRRRAQHVVAVAAHGAAHCCSVHERRRRVRARRRTAAATRRRRRRRPPRSNARALARSRAARAPSSAG
mmetsp:Transcript_44085/g.108241  ORF Transcript_44085/g.108241 Transcript_44085/m.108241 type:complete len:208 (-) Transcript_44085:877-1500(-)